MHLNTLLFIAATAEISFATRCGSTKPGKDLIHLHIGHAQKSSLARLVSTSKVADDNAKPFKAQINTYVHVIGTQEPSEDGYITAGTVSKQINVLNEAYASAGFNFNLKKLDRSKNTSWFEITDGSDAEYDMKSTLRNKGKYSDLNIYFTRPTSDDGSDTLLGYATFPTALPDTPTFLLDGVVLNLDTVPGGPEPEYNLGITAVHEVGHWLGLLHTFSDDGDANEGCDGPGDHVFDTPAEKNASFGCEVGRDTCNGSLSWGGLDELGMPTSVEGADPIHNYMDYSDDSCLSGFTNGQIQRMQDMYTSLRTGSQSVYQNSSKNHTKSGSSTLS